MIDELPMIKGYAYIAWLIENHPFADAVAKSPRYIAQEADRLAELEAK